MGYGMANFGLQFASNFGVSDMVLNVNFRSFLECMYKGQMYLVGVMVM